MKKIWNKFQSLAVAKTASIIVGYVDCTNLLYSSVELSVKWKCCQNTDR